MSLVKRPGATLGPFLASLVLNLSYSTESNNKTTGKINIFYGEIRNTKTEVSRPSRNNGCSPKFEQSAMYETLEDMILLPNSANF